MLPCVRPENNSTTIKWNLVQTFMVSRTLILLILVSDSMLPLAFSSQCRCRVLVLACSIVCDFDENFSIYCIGLLIIWSQTFIFAIFTSKSAVKILPFSSLIFCSCLWFNVLLLIMSIKWYLKSLVMENALNHSTAS